MKSIAIFLNSPYLGGAERSIVHQAHMIKESANFQFFIPQLSEPSLLKKNELESFIYQLFPKSTIHYIVYPSALYKISRSGKINIIAVFISLLKMIILDIKIRLKDIDCLWVNGNKIGLVIFLYALSRLYDGHLTWHFRDYPTRVGVLGKIWSLFSLKLPFQLLLIGNSNSVTSSIKEVIKNKSLPIYTIYNPTGEKLPSKKNLNGFPREIKLGLVSMAAPWKGIHDIILWSSIYEKELKKLNVSSLLVYGTCIYKTKGEHDHYYSQIKNLKSKLNNNILKFMGLDSPINIYNNIDILIHSSIKPEPFGRVIVEAWKSEVPVLSTCLGGSSELIIDQQTGLKFVPHDHKNLFIKIKSLIENNDLKNKIIKGANLKLIEIESEIKSKLEEAIINRL